MCYQRLFIVRAGRGRVGVSISQDAKQTLVSDIKPLPVVVFGIDRWERRKAILRGMLRFSAMTWMKPRRCLAGYVSRDGYVDAEGRRLADRDGYRFRGTTRIPAHRARWKFMHAEMLGVLWG